MIIVKILGGLGNQMFQYAFYRALKENYQDVKIDILSIGSYDLHNGYELKRVFKNIKYDCASISEIEKMSDCKNNLLDKIRRKILGLKKSYYYEKKLCFHEDFNVKAENKYFDGYWQTEKYFIKIEEIIRKDFVFTEFTRDKNITISSKIKEINSVGIHIRRGDYVNHPLYSNICTKEYYKKAIKYMKNKEVNPIFFVFSNDIAWCKKNLDLVADIYFIDWNSGNESYRDMQLMSLCKHNIIANSSFSWWGAWLNSNPIKIVIAPLKMLNDDRDTSDFIPKSWIRI